MNMAAIDTPNLSPLLLCAGLVMFMQAGFALVETGLCRAKNAAHTMWMGFMAYALAITGVYVCGYAIFDGGKGIFLAGIVGDDASIASVLFTSVFVAVTVAIPVGALAERWNTRSYCLFSVASAAVLYPTFAHWVWSGGWLARLNLGHGLLDYAGSGVIHLQGGAVALVACWLLGPRIGKYDQAGRPSPILGHDVPFMLLGTFILAFGWLGLNAGHSLIANDGLLGIILINSILASAAGALASALYMWFIYGKPDPSFCSNGMLAGLVAIAAPCAFVAPSAAFVIGAVAGIVVVWSVFFWEKRGIDDPVGAISVHGVSGAWGLLALGLFADGMHGSNGSPVSGLFCGGGKQFLAQLVGIAVCLGWNLIIGGGLFWIVGKVVGGNRTLPQNEIAGLDVPEVGVRSYPEFIEAIAPEQVSEREISAARQGNLGYKL